MNAPLEFDIAAFIAMFGLFFVVMWLLAKALGIGMDGDER